MIRLTPPTRRAFVSSGWGDDRSYRGGWHEGLDFPDSEGAPVLAAAPGRVVHVDNEPNTFAGRWVAVDHGGGVVTRYMHNLRNDVHVGQQVSRGQRIGLVGSTGTKSGKPHVHFDVKLSKSALAEYARRFGTPTTGFGRTFSHGIGAPAEALMSGATYSDRAKKAATSRGVRFYAGVSLATMALLGFIAWGIWRLTR